LCCSGFVGEGKEHAGSSKPHRNAYRGRGTNLNQGTITSACERHTSRKHIVLHDKKSKRHNKREDGDIQGKSGSRPLSTIVNGADCATEVVKRQTREYDAPPGRRREYSVPPSRGDGRREGREASGYFVVQQGQQKSLEKRGTKNTFQLYIRRK